MAVVTLSIQFPPSRGLCDSRHLCAKALNAKTLEQILMAFSECQLAKKQMTTFGPNPRATLTFEKTKRTLDLKATYNVANLYYTHTPQYYIRLDCPIVYSTILHCIVLYCILLYYIAPSFTVLYYAVSYTRLYCMILYCPILDCTV